jgi:hypothetical protein
MSPAVLHLFTAFFLHRLGDYPSLLPSLHALTALVVRFSGSFDARHSDVEDIVVSVHKELHIPSLAQSIRQRYYSFALLLLNTPAVLKLVLSLDDDVQRDFVGNLVGAGDGEKDPRCLLLYLELLEAVCCRGFAPGALSSHVNSIFDNTTAYFPITFNPPADDPYGITHDKLVQRLLGVLQCRPLLALAAPYAVEQLASDVDFAKVQASNLVLRLSKAYGVTGLASAGGGRAILRDVASGLHLVVCGSDALPTESEASGSSSSIHNAAGAAFSAIKGLSAGIEKEARTKAPTFAQNYADFTQALLDKISSALQASQSLQSMNGQKNAAIAVQLCHSGYITRSAVLTSLVPLIMPKLVIAANSIIAASTDHGVNVSSASTPFVLLGSLVASLPRVDQGSAPEEEQEQELAWSRGLVAVLLRACGCVDDAVAGGSATAFLDGDGHTHMDVVHEARAGAEAGAGVEADDCGSGAAGSGGCCGGGAHDHSHNHNQGQEQGQQGRVGPLASIPSTFVGVMQSSPLNTPASSSTVAPSSGAALASALACAIKATAETALRLLFSPDDCSSLLVRLVAILQRQRGDVPASDAAAEAAKQALGAIAACSSYATQVESMLASVAVLVRDPLTAKGAFRVVAIIAGSGGGGGGGGVAKGRSVLVDAALGAVSSALARALPSSSPSPSVRTHALRSLVAMLESENKAVVAAALSSSLGATATAAAATDAATTPTLSSILALVIPSDDDEEAAILCSALAKLVALWSPVQIESNAAAVLPPLLSSSQPPNDKTLSLLLACVGGAPQNCSLFSDWGAAVAQRLWAYVNSAQPAVSSPSSISSPSPSSSQPGGVALSEGPKCKVCGQLALVLSNRLPMETATSFATNVSSLPLTSPLAVEVVVNAARGLAMRAATGSVADQTAQALLQKISHYLTTTALVEPSERLSRLLLASRLFLLTDEAKQQSGLVLSRALLWRQRLSSRLSGELLAALRAPRGAGVSATPSDDRLVFQVGLCSLSADMPVVVLAPEIAGICVEALTGALAESDGGEGDTLVSEAGAGADPASQAERVVLGRCTQSILQLLLHMLSTDASLAQLSAQIPTLAPLLVVVAQHASPVCRHQALEILLALSACPYPKLHPVRQLVITGLARVCDDRKRAVRMLAAKVRNVFFTLK